MKSSLCCLVLLACAAATAFAEQMEIKQKSVKSDIFKPLRANKLPILNTECGKLILVTEPFGVLDHGYNKSEEAAPSSLECSWRLRAPENHVVNVISNAILLENSGGALRTRETWDTTWIALYDGVEAKQASLLNKFDTRSLEHFGPFVRSLSSGRDMVVEVKFRELDKYSAQEVGINYEFLRVDEMNRLLRDFDGKLQQQQN